MQMRDRRAQILLRLVGVYRHLVTHISTLTARALWSAWGIEFGPGLKVVGWAIVRRRPTSSITIGPQCTFLSFRGENIAGLNRPCHLCTIRPEARVLIGAGCGFSGTVIGAAESITIGNRVMCATNVTITDTDWHNIAISQRLNYSSLPSAPVVIEDDVWLGMNVTVLKGVRIGAGSVVAAGSVVTQNLPAGTICGGMPARVLRNMTAEELEPQSRDRENLNPSV